jgi:hypothetical protein
MGRRKQKAKGKRQKAKIKNVEAPHLTMGCDFEGKRRIFCLLPFDFFLLPFAFFSPSSAR